MEEHCSVEVSQARCCLPFAVEVRKGSSPFDTGRRFHFGWRLLLGVAEEAGMKGWREHAADVFTEKG